MGRKNRVKLKGEEGPWPRCYAAELGGCSDSPNKEHFVSKALLKEFEEETGLNVIGYPHGNTGQILISAESMCAKVLCEKHNNALSDVDTEGSRFILSFLNTHMDLLDRKITANKKYEFQGPLIERWLLKYCWGLIASGQGGIGKERIIRKSPPIEFLEVLFGLKALPPRWGLYVRPTSKIGIQERKNLTLALYLPKRPTGTHLVTGVKMIHYGFTSVLVLMNPKFSVLKLPDSDRPILSDAYIGTDLEGAIRHPDFFRFSHKPTSRTVEIRLKWPEKSGLLGCWPLRGKDSGFDIDLHKGLPPAG
jgi:hypothetical protein